MTERATAETLMTKAFPRIGADHTLMEAAGILLDPMAAAERSQPMVVILPDGQFGGMLSARQILDAAAPKDETPADGALPAEWMRQRLNTPVREVMNRNIPAIPPDAGLYTMMELMTRHETECLPVEDDGRIIGIVRLAKLFIAAASLALTPRTEGIRLE